MEGEEEEEAFNGLDRVKIGKAAFKCLVQELCEENSNEATFKKAARPNVGKAFWVKATGQRDSSQGMVDEAERLRPLRCCLARFLGRAGRRSGHRTVSFTRICKGFGVLC